jgi:hypothetical protein
MRDSVAVWHQVDAAISTLVMTEANVGLTFAQAAAYAVSTRECLHNRKLARRAYENAQRWLLRVRQGNGDDEAVQNKLQLLEEMLRRLGDPMQKSEC